MSWLGLAASFPIGLRLARLHSSLSVNPNLMSVQDAFRTRLALVLVAVWIKCGLPWDHDRPQGSGPVRTIAMECGNYSRDLQPAEWGRTVYFAQQQLSECPLCAKSRHQRHLPACPLYPKSGHYAVRLVRNWDRISWQTRSCAELAALCRLSHRTVEQIREPSPKGDICECFSSASAVSR